MSVCECVSEEGGREGGGGRGADYRTKNKNPTRQCGDQVLSRLVLRLSRDIHLFVLFGLVF